MRPVQRTTQRLGQEKDGRVGLYAGFWEPFGNFRYDISLT
jgi:hypothetical protein